MKSHLLRQFGQRARRWFGGSRQDRGPGRLGPAWNVLGPHSSRKLEIEIVVVLQVSVALAVSLVFPSRTRAASVGPAGLEAAAELLKSFRVPEDLQVSLYACEPTVRNPAHIDVDERGRVWVMEGAPDVSEGGRIMILQDTDADGLADQATIFYQDPSLNSAGGICVLGNRVIVSSPPHVFVLTDSDHDGKAEKREILFTDIAGRDGHGVSPIAFGPDGKLYFSFDGDAKQLRSPVRKECALHGQVLDVPATNCVDLAGNEVTASGESCRQGVVVRCNLDGSGLEPVAWNFHSASKIAVDSFGALWRPDRDGTKGSRGGRINCVMQGGNYGDVDEWTGQEWDSSWRRARARGASDSERPLYFWHQTDPGVVPNLILIPNGSPTDLLVYEGKGLPRRFWNQLIVCDAGSRALRACRLTADGAGYKVETEEILSSADPAFQPSGACVAPDGSIYLLDGNVAGAGGRAGVRGRIYRLARKGIKPSLPPQDWTTAHGWVGALQSGNLATRYLAWTKLNAEQGAAERYLLILSRSLDPPYRARALQLLARIKGSEEKYMAKCVQDTNADVRLVGLRVAVAEKRDTMPLVHQLIKEASPQVRRECAVALRHSAAAEAPRLWAELAAQFDGQDRWFLEALGIGADGQWDRYFDAWLAEVGPNWYHAPGPEIVWRSRSKKTPALLVHLLKNATVSPTQKERSFRSLDFISGPEKDAALVELRAAGIGPAN